VSSGDPLERGGDGLVRRACAKKLGERCQAAQVAKPPEGRDRCGTKRVAVRSMRPGTGDERVEVFHIGDDSEVLDRLRAVPMGKRLAADDPTFGKTRPRRRAEGRLSHGSVGMADPRAQPPRVPGAAEPTGRLDQKACGVYGRVGGNVDRPRLMRKLFGVGAARTLQDARKVLAGAVSAIWRLLQAIWALCAFTSPTLRVERAIAPRRIARVA